MGRRAKMRNGRDYAAFLMDQLQALESSERAWREMTSPDSDDDVWGDVEEHLIGLPNERTQKRWKYFAK